MHMIALEKLKSSATERYTALEQLQEGSLFHSLNILKD